MLQFLLDAITSEHLSKKRSFQRHQASAGCSFSHHHRPVAHLFIAQRCLILGVFKYEFSITSQEPNAYNMIVHYRNLLH